MRVFERDFQVWPFVVFPVYSLIFHICPVLFSMISSLLVGLLHFDDLLV